MITADSPLIGKPSGTLDAVLDYAGTDNAEYVKEVWRLGLMTGIDPALIVAQWAHETADGTSPRWVKNRNPAGLGIEADSDADPATLTQFYAANLHVWCLAEFDWRPGTFETPESVQAFRERWRQKLKDPNFPRWVRRVADLQKRYVDSSGEPQAVWAWDDRYAAKLIAKHRAIFGEGAAVTENITFGRVPHPTVTESHLTTANPYVKLGAPAIPEAVFWHRMVGTWEGTNGWFHAGNAATAYGVAVAATDGDKAGRIYEWIDPGTHLYGESSGPAVGPYGDGAALIAKVGVGGVNRTTKAIEISGNYDTPLDEKARAAIVAITAYWADQRKIPWHSFPMVPGEDRSFVIWHQEITGPAYKLCPGAVVMNETPALIKRVADVLKQYQAVAPPVKPPVYTPSELPDWWDEHVAQSWPSDADWDGQRFRVCRRRAEAIKQAVRRSAPDKKAPKSGPNVQVREKVYVERVLDSGWIVTNDGHYVASASFSPRMIVKPR